MSEELIKIARDYIEDNKVPYTISDTVIEPTLEMGLILMAMFFVVEAQLELLEENDTNLLAIKWD